MTWLRMLHLLALGLWVGASAFFSFCTALPIIARMRKLATTPENWLGLTEEKQGTRLAGEALDVVFARYFPWQVACGLIALVTACAWLALPGWINKVRVGLLAVALGLAALNLFVLAPRVHEARLQRYDDKPEISQAAEAAFGRLHGYSLACDLTTLALATLALILAAYLPAPPE